MRLIVIGRDPRQAQVVLNNDFISSYHAEIIQLDNGDMFIVDKSTNGTFLNGSRLSPGKETPVRYGDSVTFTQMNIPLNWAQIQPLQKPSDVKEIRSIGSNYMNTICLKSNAVSRFHATMIRKDNGKWYISDHSTNGTQVNGVRIPKDVYRELKAGDNILCAGVPVENPVKASSALSVIGIVAGIVLLLGLGIWGVTSIERPKQDEEIIAMYDNSVAMVYCSYHFKVTCGTLDLKLLGDPDSYNPRLGGFTERLFDEFVIDEAGNISRFEGNSMNSQGTAFFIGDEGYLVTNRHVARPWEGDKMTLGESIVTVMQAAEDAYRGMLTYLYEKHEPLALPYISQIKVTGIIDGLHIIPNGHYKIASSLYTCSEVACGTEEEDLAILKIMANEQPSSVTPVPLKKIKDVDFNKGGHILSIGFPMGTTIMPKKDVQIQAHAVTGSVTRNDDQYTFGIDAVSRPGASGSPIFDEYGNLIGILNSGFANTQGYNFGVKAKYLLGLLKNNDII